MIKQIKKWEIIGAVVTIVFGSLLHFVFDWSGGLKIVALFGAANESTWEHLKLAFWPTLIFTTLEWFVFGKTIKNFCWASFIKLISMPIIIMLLFYGWILIFPDNFIWDISIFVFAVIFGFSLSYEIIKSQKTFGSEKLWLILIIIGILIFSLFTYFPPKIFAFQDPVKGGYGIEK